MITEAILLFFGSIFDWLLGALPTVEAPDWFSNVSAVAGTVFGYANSMGAWFPTALAFTVAGTLVATWLIAFGIKAARLVLSLFTGGGGSAA